MVVWLLVCSLRASACSGFARGCLDCVWTPQARVPRQPDFRCPESRLSETNYSNCAKADVPPPRCFNSSNNLVIIFFSFVSHLTTLKVFFSPPGKRRHGWTRQSLYGLHYVLLRSGWNIYHFGSQSFGPKIEQHDTTIFFNRLYCIYILIKSNHRFFPELNPEYRPTIFF